MTTIDSIRIDLEALTGKFFDGINKATKGLSQFNKDFAKTADKVGKDMTTRISAPLAAVAAGALAAGQHIEGLERKIRISTGASGASLAKLADDFRALGRETPAALSSVADVVGNLNTQTGLMGESLRDLGRVTIEASRLLGEDAGANATALGKAMVKFGLDADQGTEAMARLFDASQRYNISVGDQLRQINAYGDVLKNAGLSVTEITDLFGRLNLAGTSLEAIMPGINAATRKFASQNIDLREGLRRTVDRVRDASTSIEALNIATETFGAEGAQRLVVAIRNGAFTLDGLGSQLTMTADGVVKLADESKTLTDELAELRNRGILALEPLGAAIADLLRRAAPLVEKMASAVERLGERFGNMHPAAQASVIALGGLAAAAGPALVGLGFLANGLGAVTTAARVAGAALTGTTAKILGLAALPLAGFGLGTLLFNEFRVVRETAAEAIVGVQILFERAKQITVNAVGNLGLAFVGAWSTLNRGALNAIADTNIGIARAINGMAGTVLDRGAAFVRTFTDFYADVSTTLMTIPGLSNFAGAFALGSQGLGAVGEGLDAAKAALDVGANAYLATVDNLRDSIVGRIEGAEDKIRNAISLTMTGANMEFNANIDRLGAELNIAMAEIAEEFGEDRAFGARFADRVAELAGPAMEKAKELAAQLAERLGFVADEAGGAAEAVGQVNAALAGGGEISFDAVAQEGEKAADHLANAFRGAANQIGSAISGMVRDGKLNLASLAEGILDTVIQTVIVQRLLDSLFGTSSAGGIGGIIGSIFSAQGNAFDGRRVLPFASGGVISSPIAFPLAGNTMGIAGEAGPEAIMPLTRTSGGDLGVRAEGMGGMVQVNIIDQRSGGERVGVSESTGPNGERAISVLIRDAVKDAMGNGSLDRAFGQNFGIRRKGRAP